MYTYDGNQVTLTTLYKYDGTPVRVGADVGWVTDPEYKTVNGDSYRLVWHDEFEGKDLDRNFWTDVHFISNVSRRYQAWDDYCLQDGILYLRLKKDSPNRYLDDPAASGQTGQDVSICAIQTAQANRLGDGEYREYRWHDVNPFYGLITQEGYYECRMKVFTATGGCHTAWWVVGVPDNVAPYARSGEIDITEILGSNTNQLPHGQHPNGDSSIDYQYHYSTPGVNFATDYHTVGFLWENGTYKWYVDGALVDTMSVRTIQYPVFHILAAYKRRSGTGWTGDADQTLKNRDVSFDVDYVRIYKKATNEATEEVTVASYEPITIDATTADMTINSDTGCPNAFPFYVYVYWSDGSRTEHWVKWNPTQETYQGYMTNQTDFEWLGYVYGLGIEVKANVTY